MPVTFYETADVAEILTSQGFRITPAGIRSAVRDGRMSASMLTPRGRHGWTPDDVRGAILAQARARFVRGLLRRPEPVQLPLLIQGEGR